MSNLLISEKKQKLNTIRPHDRLVVKYYDKHTDRLVSQWVKTGVSKVLRSANSLFRIRSCIGDGSVELELLSSNQIVDIPLERISNICEISKTDSYNEQKLFQITLSKNFFIRFTTTHFFKQFLNARI